MQKKCSHTLFIFARTIDFFPVSSYNIYTNDQGVSTVYKLCKTEQSAKRQRELEQVLLRMMNSTLYEDITVMNFCENAGIPRKAFYRYFSSKDGALHALLDHTLLELESFPAQSKAGAAGSLKQELIVFFRFWQAQKPLLDALQRSGISGILVTRSIEYAMSGNGIAQLFPLQENMGSRQFDTIFGVSGFMSMVLSWHRTGYQLPAEQMAQIGTNLLTKPLLQAQGT